MADAKKEAVVLDDKDADIFESMEDILGTDGTEYRTVKSWGGKMARIGSLTAGQLITFLENNEIAEKKRQNGLMLIALSLVNKEGERLVDVTNPEAVQAAIEKLKTRDANANGHVVEAVLLLNGLNKKDAVNIAKNALGEAPTGASPTA